MPVGTRTETDRLTAGIYSQRESQFARQETKMIQGAVDLEDDWKEYRLGGLTFRMRMKRNLEGQTMTETYPLTKTQRKALRKEIGLPVDHHSH